LSADADFVCDQRSYNARSKVIARERERALQRERERQEARQWQEERERKRQERRSQREERRSRRQERETNTAAVWPSWCQKLAIVLKLRRPRPE
jgi:hypothetical protein